MSDSPTSTYRAGQRCPTCGERLVAIAYGEPGPEMFEAAERDEIALGGCVVQPDNATHRCPQGHEWGRLGWPTD